MFSAAAEEIYDVLKKYIRIEPFDRLRPLHVETKLVDCEGKFLPPFPNVNRLSR